jgi:hypothetical protein
MAPREPVNIVRNHSRWRRTLAAEKAAQSRNDPNSVARHSNGDGYYNDEVFKPKPTLPKLRLQEIPPSPSGGDI